MIREKRVKRLNNEPVRGSKYVLYWMQAAQRAEYNHALEYSIQRANTLKVPVVVLFGIADNYPEANLRHYHFMLEGLKETENTLGRRGIQFVVKHKSPELAVVDIAAKACIVIVDAGHTRVQRQWRRYAAMHIQCSLEEVETNLIVPVTEASEKENFSAGTFRPRITAKLKDYLVELNHIKPLYDSSNMKFAGFDISDTALALSKLHIDKSVGPVRNIKGGTAEAKRRLNAFIRDKLESYAELRNDPCLDATSNMSPYLHFGQISPLYIALKVLESNSHGKEAYLEELIVRRELSHNFVFYNCKYDKFDCLPVWARNTLNLHSYDKREYVYSLKEFEQATTHDPYWNAAQKEMIITGKMHGYMRMYWGKKILEWSRSPKEGFRIALYLNNKYELDGRDPNGYAGVAWCFGKHDRAWGERKVFGKIRYMNAAGLKRKFDPNAYIKKVEQMEKGTLV
jgi:deoxyribodipyrimidine photo-lyase